MVSFQRVSFSHVEGLGMYCPPSLRQFRLWSMFSWTFAMMTSNNALSILIFFHAFSAAPLPCFFG